MIIQLLQPKARLPPVKGGNKGFGKRGFGKRSFGTQQEMCLTVMPGERGCMFG